MFKKLFNFSYKRTTKQAVGFYIAFLVLLFVLALLSSSIVALIANTNSVALGVRVGNTVAVLLTLALSFTILYEKKKLDNYVYLIIALVSGILAFYGGGLLGLIPVAFLTTK